MKQTCVLFSTVQHGVNDVCLISQNEHVIIWSAGQILNELRQIQYSCHRRNIAHNICTIHSQQTIVVPPFRVHPVHAFIARHEYSSVFSFSNVRATYISNVLQYIDVSLLSSL